MTDSDRPFARPELRQALLAVAGEKGGVNSRRLGRYLARNADRIVSGLRVVKAGESHHAIKWRCEKTGA